MEKIIPKSVKCSARVNVTVREQTKGKKRLHRETPSGLQQAVWWLSHSSQGGGGVETGEAEHLPTPLYR